MSFLWFFERLGIAPTNDARAIKRAYAVALKRLDQQQERESFESLREAYEMALAWAQWTHADAQADADEDEEELSLEIGSDRHPVISVPPVVIAPQVTPLANSKPAPSLPAASGPVASASAPAALPA